MAKPILVVEADRPYGFPKRESKAELYRLKYIKGNDQHWTLVRFTQDLELEDLVKAAKHYCAVQNIRFVFIEPAIITIDTGGELSS